MNTSKAQCHCAALLLISFLFNSWILFVASMNEYKECDIIVGYEFIYAVSSRFSKNNLKAFHHFVFFSQTGIPNISIINETAIVKIQDIPHDSPPHSTVWLRMLNHDQER